MKSYIDYKFLGVHSFIETLEAQGIDHKIFNDDYSDVYKDCSEIINENDKIRTGLITKDEQGAFFTEIGIKLTENYYSYIVFIFDHHPQVDEIKSVASLLESIISTNIDSIDLSMFADRLSGKETH